MSFSVFVSRDFELGRTWLAGRVDRQSRKGLIFFLVLLVLLLSNCSLRLVPLVT